MCVQLQTKDPAAPTAPDGWVESQSPATVWTESVQQAKKHINQQILTSGDH